MRSTLDAVKKAVDALASKLAPPRGGRGGGRGNTDNLNVTVAQAKNALMGGMVVGELTTNAVSETRVQAPRAIADLNGVLTKASALSASLAKYNMTLNVPQPIKLPEDSSARRRSSNPQR
jgi:hypothetical protein